MTIRDKVNEMFNTPMNQLPTEFMDTLKGVVSFVAFSGDVFADTAAVWIKYGQGKAMPPDDVFSADYVDLNEELL